MAVQTAAGARPATRVVHRAAVFPSQVEKTDYMSDPVGKVPLDRLSYLLSFSYWDLIRHSSICCR